MWALRLLDIVQKSAPNDRKQVLLDVVFRWRNNLADWELWRGAMRKGNAIFPKVLPSNSRVGKDLDHEGTGCLGVGPMPGLVKDPPDQSERIGLPSILYRTDVRFAVTLISRGTLVDLMNDEPFDDPARIEKLVLVLPRTDGVPATKVAFDHPLHCTLSRLGRHFEILEMKTWIHEQEAADAQVLLRCLRRWAESMGY